MRNTTKIILSAIVLFSCTFSQTWREKVVVGGYVPDYRTTPSTDQMSKLSEIILFSLKVSSTQTLLTDEAPKFIATAVSAANTAGVKPLICIGGWGRSENFSAAAASVNSRAKLASAINAYLSTNKLEGVDIDWEFPSSSEMNNFALLLKAIKDSIGTKKLSVAIGSSHPAASLPDGLFAAVDQINLMAYDMGNPHSSYDDAIKLLDSWGLYCDNLAKKGVKTSRKEVVLGLPFYGKDWSNAYTYARIIGSGGSATADQSGSINYNGQTTIKKKTAYAAKNGYGGVFIWEVAQDLDAKNSKSLLKALNDTLSFLYPVAIAQPRPSFSNAQVNVLHLSAQSIKLTLPASITGYRVGVSVLTLDGRLLETAFSTVRQGTTEVRFIRNLPKGVYLFRVVSGPLDWAIQGRL